MKKSILVLCLTVPGAVQATPGAIDKYGCHRNVQTHEYHCHKDQASVLPYHSLLGLTLSSDLWTYENSNDPVNFFGGIGLAAEYAYKFIGVYGDATYKPHWTGIKEFYLSGWSIGLKLGPSLSDLGAHPYATMGYFAETFNTDTSSTYDLSGYQLGAGLIYNFSRFAIDGRALYRNPESTQEMWTNYEAPGLDQHLGFELSAYIRF